MIDSSSDAEKALSHTEIALEAKFCAKNLNFFVAQKTRTCFVLVLIRENCFSFQRTHSFKH
jgi:hypothetical protein